MCVDILVEYFDCLQPVWSSDSLYFLALLNLTALMSPCCHIFAVILGSKMHHNQKKRLSKPRKYDPCYNKPEFHFRFPPLYVFMELKASLPRSQCYMCCAVHGAEI